MNRPTFHKGLLRLKQTLDAQLRATAELNLSILRTESANYKHLSVLVSNMESHLREAHHLCVEAREYERKLRTKE